MQHRRVAHVVALVVIGGCSLAVPALAQNSLEPVGHSHGFEAVAVSGGCAYVTCGPRVIDVSTPSAPVEVGFCATEFPALGVAAAGAYVDVAAIDGYVPGSGGLAFLTACTLFPDGFETGDTSAWSATVP